MVAVVPERDMHGVGVPEEVVHVVQDLLIGADQEDLEKDGATRSRDGEAAWAVVRRCR